MEMIALAFHKYNRFVRFAIVGGLTNALGYLIYLSITTWSSLGPISTMTMLYFTGVFIGFIGNRQWTFRHTGAVPESLIRYLVVHSGGYCINFMLLYVFTTVLQYPHQVVQAVAIIIVALYLFTAFKYYVFVSRNEN